MTTLQFLFFIAIAGRPGLAMLSGLKAVPLTLLSWFAELVEQTHNGLSPFSLFALMILLLFLGSIIYFGLRWLARSGRGH